jgi:hypothetical protein
VQIIMVDMEAHINQRPDNYMEVKAAQNIARLDRVTGILRRGKVVLLELGALSRVGVGSTYEEKVLRMLDAADAKRRR